MRISSLYFGLLCGWSYGTGDLLVWLTLIPVVWLECQLVKHVKVMAEICNVLLTLHKQNNQLIEHIVTLVKNDTELLQLIKNLEKQRAERN